MSAVVDLAEVTEVTEIVVDGHTLWVRSGATKDGGRYWQFLTECGMRVAMVVERGGKLVAVFEPVAPNAERLIVAGLCRCGLGGAS